MDIVLNEVKCSGILTLSCMKYAFRFLLFLHIFYKDISDSMHLFLAEETILNIIQ